MMKTTQINWQIEDLIQVSKNTRAEIKKNQAGVGTLFQLTFIKFIDSLKVMLGKFGSTKAVMQNLPEEECTIISEKLNVIDQILRRRESGRFVTWSERILHHGNQGEDRSEIGYFETLSSQGQFDCLTWKGLPLFKSAVDYAVIPMLIFELKPQTILEIGSGAGTSAMWLSDIATSFNLKTHIYSLDINRPKAAYSEVTYIEGDAFRIQKTFTPAFLEKLPKPFLVIEDAHENVLEVLIYLQQFLTRGDYFFIEDSGFKRNILDEFMSTHGGDYRIDTYYTDLFGKNSVSAYDSIFRRM
jgi:cephalosporin hydroxylase